MSLTYNQARDEIFELFKTSWDTTGYQAHYQDVRKDRSNLEVPWACIFLKHSDGFQSTLGYDSRAFTRLGFITVQIFTPAGKGLQLAYTLAKVVSDAFEGKSTSGGVWFRNVKINEGQRDGEFNQLNVVIDFRYDEIK